MRHGPRRAVIVALSVTISLAAALRAQEPPRQPGDPERVQVTRVLVDLVVRDRKEHPVRGLTRDDFRIEIDGDDVDSFDVRSFEEICAARPARPQAAGPRAAADPDDARPAPISPESEAPLRRMALYFDFSQLSMAGRIRALGGALEFFRCPIPQGERVMLMTSLGGGLDIVQEFTGDASLIHRHLRQLLDDKDTVDPEVVDEASKVEDLAGFPTDQWSKTRLAEDLARREWQRALNSLHSLRMAIEALAPYRGRKAMLFFGDLLRREPGRQYIGAARGHIGALGPTIGGPLKQVTGLANAANISFYTVDLEGLRLNDPIVIDKSNASSQLLRHDAGDHWASAHQSAEDFRQHVTEDTGGRNLRGTNDMAAVFDGARGDLSCYYLAGIRWDGKGDGAVHRIAVRFQKRKGVSRRGMRITHRPYFVDGPGR